MHFTQCEDQSGISPTPPFDWTAKKTRYKYTDKKESLLYISCFSFSFLYLFSNMKSLHCVYSANRFADQYTLDLEGFVSNKMINQIDINNQKQMSPHEFTATINTFNTAAWHYPPPNRIGTGSLNYYLFCLSTIVLVAVITAIHYTHQIGLILVLPFSFLLFSLIIIYWRRRKMNRVSVYL
jgi:hypothetical protein